jgi:hypothetical protein
MPSVMRPSNPRRAQMSEGVADEIPRREWTDWPTTIAHRQGQSYVLRFGDWQPR